MTGIPFTRPKLTPQTKQLLLDSAVFQLFWFASILSPHVPMQIAALILWSLASPWPGRLWLIAGVLAMLGSAVDAMWIQSGLFLPHDSLPGPFTVPLWLMLLWLACARYLLTLVSCVTLPSYALFLLGAITGPLSYLAAAQLGAASLQYDSALLWLGFILWWGGVMLLINHLGTKS
ncbi:DUF2878 domain-containing protein [Ferrimonas sp. YFM]|uniref:DUF2878 domain-containing protein n=1 Tax=Ferrimonas sp. YFM TaxID=3028878 RepID=UPI0025724936|nr:DUF2878 domain-containing protein [Ferrimonas sp. YFM]BDY03693.1 hypothetical protein F0521_07340 [Ferrimonas sp. YFM]